MLIQCGGVLLQELKYRISGQDQRHENKYVALSFEYLENIFLQGSG